MPVAPYTLYAAQHTTANPAKANGRKFNRLVQRPDLGGAFFASNGKAMFPVTPSSFPAGLPTASADYAGVQAYVPAAAGSADTLVICLKSASDTWSWKTISTG